MQRQRYYQIVRTLQDSYERACLSYNVELTTQIRNARIDLENAALKHSAMLQKRSKITQNEIRTFIGSGYKMTPTKARLLKAAGLA